MPFGQIFNQGVRYIKVNRFDSGGLDRSDYLGQLTNLTITYDDLGPITYDIVTTQEQNDYFVYGIETRNQATQSVNYEVLDYSFVATSASSFTNIPDSEDQNWGGIKIGAFGSVIGNSLNYLNINNAKYTLGNTPNVSLQVRFSGSYTLVGSNTTILIGAGEENTGIFESTEASYQMPVTIGTNNFDVTVILSSSRNLIENNNIVFGVGVIYGETVNITFNSFHVSLSLYSASVNPSTSSLIIFEPEFIDFEYNDYNALFGNAEVPQFSLQFMDVDYTSTYDEPVNFGLIISGTADRAPVQDSNYTSYTWSGLRYWGSRYNSFNTFNYVPQSKTEFIRLGGTVTTNVGNFNDPSLDGSGYGELPAVEQNQTFIAYFDGVGGTGPELIGQTAYNIKYLIDTQGNVVNPEPGVASLYNLIDNFESGKKATVKLIGNDPSLTENPNDDSLTGTHQITYVGRIAPILITETGSSLNAYIPTMSFDSGPNIPDVLDYRFRGKRFGGEQTITPNAFTAIDFPTTTLNTVGSNWNGSNTYTFTNPGDTLIGLTRVKFEVKIAARPSIQPGMAVSYFIIKNPGVTEEILATTSVPLYNNPDGTPTVTYLETEYLNFETTDIVRVLISNPNPSNARIMPGTEFTLVQEYNATREVTSSYWSIGDYNANPTVITASLGLTGIYGTGFRQTQSFYVDTASIGSFNIIQTDFADLQVGDKIRFEYNENKRYNIAEVLPDGPDGKLCLKLDGQVPTGSVLDHFILYRVVNDGSYVVLNVNKPVAGYSFSGILQPEYVSQELSDNYNNIIQDLTQRNVIS